MGTAHDGKARQGKRKARVFVVDDHYLLREGLRACFEIHFLRARRRDITLIIAMYRNASLWSSRCS